MTDPASLVPATGGSVVLDRTKYPDTRNVLAIPADAFPLNLTGGAAMTFHITATLGGAVFGVKTVTLNGNYANVAALLVDLNAKLAALVPAYPVGTLAALVDAAPAFGFFHPYAKVDDVITIAATTNGAVIANGAVAVASFVDDAGATSLDAMLTMILAEAFPRP